MNQLKRLLLPPAVFLLLLVVSARTGESDLKTAATDNTAFALDLYQQLRTTKGNLFFSPYSVSTALAMTYGGAAGKTEQEMAKTLHFTLPQKQLHPAFAQLQQTLEQPDQVTLKVANALWPQKNFLLRPHFLKQTKNHYGVDITPLDFRKAEPARVEINKWVEAKTENKITELLKPGVLSSSTRLVLTNAIYFLGNWGRPFDPKKTQKAPFHVTQQKTVDVDLMNQEFVFGLAQAPDLQILEIPYKGNKLSLLVLLPSQKDGLSRLEAKLSPAQLQRWIGAIKRQKVSVFLPRFRATSQFDLTQNLKELGMKSAFTGAADFSKIAGKQGSLYIGAVIHKAFIDVNELGTEAAAATAVVMKGTAAMRKAPPVFRADHPFIYVIRHRQTESILFMGKMANPGQADG